MRLDRTHDSLVIKLALTRETTAYVVHTVTVYNTLSKFDLQSKRKETSSTAWSMDPSASVEVWLLMLSHDQQVSKRVLAPDAQPCEVLAVTCWAADGRRGAEWRELSDNGRAVLLPRRLRIREGAWQRAQRCRA